MKRLAVHFCALMVLLCFRDVWVAVTLGVLIGLCLDHFLWGVWIAVEYGGAALARIGWQDPGGWPLLRCRCRRCRSVLRSSTARIPEGLSIPAPRDSSTEVAA